MEKVFKLWPTLADMAREIGESPITVRHWKRRGMIPARHDGSIVRAAQSRGANLSLAEIAHCRANAYELKRASGLETQGAA